MVSPSELHALIFKLQQSVQVIRCRHPATQGHSGLAVFLPAADPALSFPKLPATGRRCYTRQCDPKPGIMRWFVCAFSDARTAPDRYQQGAHKPTTSPAGSGEGIVGTRRASLNGAQYGNCRLAGTDHNWGVACLLQ